ncbi:type IX secretion system anionic LPS delivery protein PorZ [Botryobacter ruber]|uniref:type IX secretion system anionic LPS delivery protein PorZ n=1 Tax=Botryobacter ruber TaxID=2171629 RepID=UPI0013E406DB|nr:two-component regulator propeller domain-containing protein [Botryobacter ruber]
MKIRYRFHRMRYFLGLMAGICLLFGSFCAVGQSKVGIGDWQVHVPYRLGKAVAEAGDKVYCATEQGLFYFDKEFNTTETLTKVDGLKEQRINAIRYDEATNTLVIGYANTNIDLLRGNRIINISDIFRKSITGEKSVNHIYIHNKLAYISCSFGVVVLDLVKLEIKDTYSSLGPAGQVVNAQATTTFGDSIYIATDRGILAAKYTGSSNLLDFNNWKNINAGIPAQARVTSLVAFNGKVYAGTAAQGLYARGGQVWQQVPVNSVNSIVSLTTGGSYLVAATPAGVLLLNQNGQPELVTNALLQQPREAIAGAGNMLWVADGLQGLVKLELTGANAVVYTPNGPFSNNSFRMYATNGRVYGLSGGYDEFYEQRGRYDGFYVYANSAWQNYNSTLYPDRADYPGVNDVVGAVYNPVTDKMYFASYGSGLLEWGGLGNYTLYNGLNSPLLTAVPDGSDKTQYIRITDLAVDAEGNVWVVNRNQKANGPGLHVLRKDNTWQSFAVPNRVDWSAMDRILIDDYDQKWLSISRRQTIENGLYVFDDETMQSRYLSIGEGSGGLPSGDIYAMAKDLNGEIWIGTGNGVAVYFNPGDVFSAQSFDAHIPIINRRPLLDGQGVRSIAVDGANRKWMATDNGLWLFSPDGDEQIYHFTTRNSPLPSDKVLSVAVEHQSGEVFIATDAGIASFRAGATVTEGTPDCATVFPNPVRSDFSGLIGISGLPNNASVRITDIAGTLVYKTQATGGTLTWDARSYNGKRVKAGVYLVMSADRDGTQSCISKIAILE